MAVFYWAYLENGLNQPMFDLNKPIGYGQFLRAVRLGRRRRRDQHLHRRRERLELQHRRRAEVRLSRRRQTVRHRPGQPPERLSARGLGARRWPAIATRRPASRTSMSPRADASPKSKQWPKYAESETDRVDKITIHDGADGKILARVAAARPLGLVCPHRHALRAAPGPTSGLGRQRRPRSKAGLPKAALAAASSPCPPTITAVRSGSRQPRPFLSERLGGQQSLPARSQRARSLAAFGRLRSPEARAPTTRKR